MRKQIPHIEMLAKAHAGSDVGVRAGRTPGATRGQMTSVDKALEICEALAAAQRGLSVSELARTLGLTAPTVHRLLGRLRRRGYVRQDEDTARYSLTLKMLDLSFRLLGRSEVRLHAYPVVREFVLRTGSRAFVAQPSSGEVTYIWTAGPDEVAMHTVYGREMPVHCAIYLEATAARRLSCLRLAGGSDVARAGDLVVRFGQRAPGTAAPQRLTCACAPVFDYTGREVARVGVFAHAPDDTGLVTDASRSAAELARLVSLRLGHLPTAVAV
jgi:DNA-binding IclR family transcriptional regulator